LKQKLLKTISFLFLSIALGFSASAQHFRGETSLRESLDDAWWTGPLYAISPETLSRGHYLIEPYVFSVRSNGTRQYVSSNYIYYGLRDNLSLGIIPAAGSTLASGTQANSGWQMGDLTALAMMRITEFNEHSHVPTIALEIQETFPTGKYDRLGNKESNGLSNGSYTTTLQANAQTYSWLPNGRILRTRLNLLGTISNTTAVSDKSIFATPEGFRGTAVPGSSFTGNIAWEYSITRHWVAALDVISQAKNTTRISGRVVDHTQSQNSPSVLQFSSPASLSFQLAPAMEYNISPNLGIIAGVGVALPGRNIGAGIAPMIAVNWYK
jgi:Putative MetA-pathway of phenol degradation